MKRRGKILTKIIISYGAMIIITIAVGIMLYIFTHGIVKTLSDVHNSNLVNVIKSVCDSEFRYYKSALEQLKTESTVQKFWRNVDEYSPEDYWNDYQLRQVMSNVYTDVQRGNADCYDLFLWSAPQKRMITATSVLTYEQYSSLVCKGITEWADYLKNELVLTVNSRVIGMYSSEKEYIVLLESANGVGTNKGDAVLGMWINADVLNYKINTIDWSEGMDWMLIDSQGKIIRHPSRFEITAQEVLKLLANSGSSIFIEDREYLISTQKSDYYEMEYILFTPEAMVNSPVNKMRNISIFSLMVVLLAGVILTTHFTRVHYRPLKILLERIRKDSSSENIVSEYVFLEKGVSDIINKKQDMEKKNQRLMHTYTLEKLLLGRGVEKNVSETADKLCDKFSRGRNVVLACCEKEESHYEKTEIIKESSLRRYVIANVFEEGISEYFEQETFEYDNIVVSIVNVPVVSAESVSILRTEIEKLRDLITNKFQFSFYTLEGGIYEGIEGISQSWIEVCRCMEFVDDLEEMYIRYDELSDLTVYSYGYSFEVEQCIVNAIRAGDSDKAKAIVDDILARCFDSPYSTVPEMQTCMLYDIYGTLVKASEEQGIHIDKMPRANWFSARRELYELLAYFHEVIEDISKQTLSKQGAEISVSIMEYIREHYSDPDLNISQIAYRFRVKPTWISATFKKETGKSILEVIRQIRIENAKKFLRDGLSVMEVSQMVGFQDTTTFIRTFKSLVGVTPGQLKNKQFF